MYPYLTIFNTRVYLFPIMIMLGVIMALVFFSKDMDKYKIEITSYVNTIIFMVIGGILGAMMLFFIVTFPQQLKNHSFFEAIMHSIGGIVFYGAIIGGIITAVVLCRKKNDDIWLLLNLVAPYITIAHGMGRIGCWLAGCCYGKEVHGITHPLFKWADGTYRIPTQLIEATGLILLFIVMKILLRYKKYQDYMFPIYTICYGVLRFVIETMRGDSIRGVVWLSTSQWISLAAIVSGVFVFRHLNQKVIPMYKSRASINLYKLAKGTVEDE